MAAPKLILFIIDDSIPKIEEYVEQSIYDKKLNAASLLHLVNTAEWTGQQNLKQLTSFILNSEHVNSGHLEVYGFTHPSLCLDAIDEGLVPNIVIYDWEYTSESHTNSSKWLTEVLNSTNAFVFVYSKVRNDIPPFLNKSDFDNYSNRFQLFLKGDTDSSVFSSEEFIHQYIVSQISKSNNLKVHGIDIKFQENAYIDKPSDILHLEKILGRLALKEKLESGIVEISDQSIEEILQDIEIKIFYDKTKNLLVTSDSQVAGRNIESTREMSAIEVLKEYGLNTLKGVLEIGIAKV